MGPDVELHVLGFDESTISYLQDSWQLWIRRAEALHGLPPSQTAEYPSFCFSMQNAAADRADQNA